MFKKAAMWIAMVFVLMSTGMSAQAATDEATGLEYEVLEDGTVEITGYSGSVAEVVIPEEIEGMTVTSIGEWAFGVLDNDIVSIDLPETITNIGLWAFAQTEIESIDLPDSLKTIGISAFNGCQKLKTIHVPQNVTSIGMYAFYNCSSLESVSIDDANTTFTVVDGILYSKDGKTLLSCIIDKQIIELPDGVTCIGESAFSGCKRVEKVVIPEGVTEIQTWAFSETFMLSEVILPESLERIGEYVFGDSGLKKIHIPKNVVSIGEAAFRTFTGEITIADENAYYTVVDDALYTKDKSEIIRYAGSESKVVLAEEVKVIATQAFAGTEVEEVVLPDALTSIGTWAFMNCTNLKEIIIPESVESISDHAFNGCTNLSKVTVLSSSCEIAQSEADAVWGNNVFPESAKLYGYAGSTLEAYANTYDRDFHAIYDLNYVELEDGTVEITGVAENAGWYIKELLIFPEIDGKTVSSIGEFAFEGKHIDAVSIPQTVKTIKNGAFYNGTLKEIVIPKSVEVLGENVFGQCANLASIQVEDGNPNYIVEDSILYTKDKKTLVRSEIDVTKVEVPEGVEIIAGSAFCHAVALQEVTLPNTVTSIGVEAFFNCQMLQKIDIPDSVESIGLSAFFDCKSLAGELKLPKNLKTLGMFAFYNCSKLSGELILPEGLTSIGDYAFTKCSGFTGDLVIPQSVTTIGNYAFVGCNGMNPHVYITEGTTDIVGSGVQVNGIMDENGNYQYTPDIWKQLTIHAPKDSYAEEFALSKGYQYEIWYDFEDVTENTYYEEPVEWAVANGITNGYGSTTTFCPELVCTRGQIVTFLWRAKGCPEPVSLDNPFTDVAADAYYYKAVLWAVEQGITNGYGSDTIFNPDGECTRGQVATFMWRAESQPANTGSNPFTDLAADGYYYDAVLWAVEKGVTNGYGSADTFCPDVICTRGQIVTFLYRGMN